MTAARAGTLPFETAPLVIDVAKEKDGGGAAGASTAENLWNDEHHSE